MLNLIGWNAQEPGRWISDKGFSYTVATDSDEISQDILECLDRQVWQKTAEKQACKGTHEGIDFTVYKNHFK